MSNRLTFSLASLFLILALGLVFAPTSVMAHPDPTGATGAAVHAKDRHMHPTVTVMVADADPNTPGTQVIPKTGNLADGAAADAREIAFDVVLALDSNVPVRDDDDTAIEADTFNGDSITAVVYNDRDGAVADFPTAGVSVFATYTEVADSDGLKWETEITFVLDDDGETGTSDAEQVAAAIAAGINLDLTAVAGLIEADVVRGPYYNDVAAADSDQGPNANLESERLTVRVITAPAAATTGDTLANNAHAVVVRDRSMAQASGYFGATMPTLIEWSDMPNLHQLFIQNTAPGGGGSLQMIAKDTAGEKLGARKVVFSEVMWAIDDRKAGSDTADDDQWFEIYNRSGAAIPIDDLEFMAKEGRPALAQETDLVSNVVGGGSQWIRTKGQNGDSGVIQDNVRVGTKEFISMYRKRYHNDSAGWNGGEWIQSTQLYKPNHRGTPGMKEAAGARTFAASAVGLTTIFNEIANFSSSNGDRSKYEWIELRIMSGDPHFENWVVDMVTPKSDRAVSENPKQDRLFTISKKLDRSRFDDILLITKTDPAGDPDHPLAAGYNVEENDADQQNGIDRNIRYYIAKDWTMDLPDDGNFVLILRHNKDKTNHERVEDVAGYVSNDNHGLTVSKADFYSDLWPLIGYPAPNLSRNQLTSGAVYRRHHTDIAGTRTKDGNKKDKTAFRGAPDNDNGYKGVGYKRGADNTAQHGGTPGYHNNVIKDKESALADDAMVSISEVMYDTGNRLPQWIELYNGSKTEAVNLNEWKLKIENDRSDEDVDIRPSPTIQFDAVIIPPNRTVIVTSTKAGQATQEIKNEQAIFDLYVEKKNDLEVDNRRYQLLSETAFKLTLMEKGGMVVDTVGNLDADPAWDLPMDEDSEGRVSVIRRYDDGDPIDGTMADGWILASDTNLRYETTYYGHSDDVGTPGFRAGGVLPVSLSKFRPERLDDGTITVRWVTESELNNAGFNILRSETRDGEFTKLNTQLIAGQGTTSEKTAYTFTDTSAKPNVVYYYQIQDVSLDGDVTTLRTTHLRGNVSAAGKLTTTWGELKTLHK